MGGTRDDGFTAYVAGRRAHLFRTAYLLCGDPHRAEDIVQTALAKLYVAWPRASRADSVDAYVRRVIINSHLDETRRPWRRESPTEDDRLDRAAPAGVAPEDADALWTALQELGPKQRRVVVLRHYWGLSVEETAADLGVSPGTVKSQTSAALEKLRTALLTDTEPPRRTAMTDPADRFLEERLHALARGVSVPLVPHRGRRTPRPPPAAPDARGDGRRDHRDPGRGARRHQPHRRRPEGDRASAGHRAHRARCPRRPTSSPSADGTRTRSRDAGDGTGRQPGRRRPGR